MLDRTDPSQQKERAMRIKMSEAAGASLDHFIAWAMVKINMASSAAILLPGSADPQHREVDL